MTKYIYGGDSETIRGEPMTFQFYSADPACADLLWVDPDKATRTLLAWCASLPARGEHVVYVHHLGFDMVSFFWDRRADLVANPSGEFEFTHGRWTITGVYGAPTYAKLVERGRNKSVYLIDSFSFFRASLAKAAEIFCPHLPKLGNVVGLGERRFSKRDAKFAEYAMRDAEIAYHMGVALEGMHREFDLRQTVSVADMAARVFRHHFLDYTIPQPDRSVIEASLAAYHGGKNNVAGAPGWYLKTSSLDISSAYPHAMHGFPAFSNEALYKRFAGGKRCARVPELGVYAVTGEVASCRWPCLYDASFKPLAGRFDSVWIGGHELNEALQSGELEKVSRIEGWFYDAERDRVPSALSRFVDDFYTRKSSETDKVKRTMYKLMLNSISGKFIQTRKRSKITHVDIDSMEVTGASDLVAGGMFHPFIAQAITGQTRARIHQLEHRYKAIHTATDGIVTQRQIKKADLSDGLGGLTCDAKGDFLMLRNKLYVMYGDDGDIPSRAFEGKNIVKYALHGFAGGVYDLEELVSTNRRKYQATRVNRLRESVKRDLVPNLFVDRDYTLKVGKLGVFEGKQ